MIPSVVTAERICGDYILENGVRCWVRRRAVGDAHTHSANNREINCDIVAQSTACIIKLVHVGTEVVVPWVQGKVNTAIGPTRQGVRHNVFGIRSSVQAEHNALCVSTNLYRDVVTCGKRRKADLRAVGQRR